MRPIDPRLVARIGPARRYIIVTSALGLLTAVLVLIQALLIARLLAPVLSPTPLDEDGLGWWGRLVPIQLRETHAGLLALALVVIIRVVATWLQERLAHRAGSQVIAELRQQVLNHASAMGPRWVASGKGSDVVTLTTRGLDALLPYFVRYLPQLALAATVTPLLFLVVLGLDWPSAVIAMVTLPLIPIFMILIGLVTQVRSAKHLDAMQRLSTRTLDVIQGLPTLAALGRERGPAARVKSLGEAQRKATMSSLKVAFLSGMVLELLTTLSVAIVAVTMGFRLVDGHVGIETALAVLVLAPEVYLPLRNVGVHFHASADGMAAADAAFKVLDEPLPLNDAPSIDPVSLAGTALTVTGLSVSSSDQRFAPHDLSFTAEPGQVTALVGPNGEGKSTALLAAMGLLAPDAGHIHARGESTIELFKDAQAQADWAAACAWVPQRPDLGLAGRKLSLGQRQRLALDRAFTSERPWLILDEPTAHLDRHSRAEVIARITEAAAQGKTVIVATHEAEVIAVAHTLVNVGAALKGDTNQEVSTHE